jgi:glycosyltransferase involved in cell wall biosynthesis
MYIPRPVAALGRLAETRLVPHVYRHRLFVTISDSSAADLEATGVAPERIRIVHNGTDLPASGAPKSPEPLFVVLGRLAPAKRVGLVLDAWDRARPQIGGRLVVVGDGPERQRLEARGVAGVEFTGRVSEPEKWELLSSAWAIVHSAAREGWGIVLMEAAAAGTPALAYDVPGVRDAVNDGRTGVLVGSEDELVSEWIALAREDDRRRRLGEEARSRSRQFGWERTVREFTAVVDEVLAPGNIPGRRTLRAVR